MAPDADKITALVQKSVNGWKQDIDRYLETITLESECVIFNLLDIITTFDAIGDLCQSECGALRVALDRLRRKLEEAGWNLFWGNFAVGETYFCVALKRMSERCQELFPDNEL
jgi:hypothetical protein